MKTLHALVGYLAATALPFHPFALASPAATDHDGYVNTVTTATQNREDIAHMKRVHDHGDIIEARQGEIAIPIVGIVVLIVGGIILKLVWDDNDNHVRGNNVEFLIGHSDQK